MVQVKPGPLHGQSPASTPPCFSPCHPFCFPYLLSTSGSAIVCGLILTISIMHMGEQKQTPSFFFSLLLLKIKITVCFSNNVLRSLFSPSLSERMPPGGRLMKRAPVVLSVLSVSHSAPCSPSLLMESTPFLSQKTTGI